MSLLRFILWSLIFYLIFRTMKNIYNAITGGASNEQRREKVRKAAKPSQIKSEDIIEAQFEEITTNIKDKSKDF